MRRQHKLRGHSGNELPQECIWLDTETHPVDPKAAEQRHILTFGYACYRRTVRPGEWTAPKWCRFETVNELWDWIEDRLHGKSKVYLFAHNWAFDAPVLDMFNQLPERGFKLTGAVIQSPPVILKWRRKPFTLAVIDTLNIWRMPLKALGDAIGLPKLDMPPQNASREDWDTYAHRDVEIIMQACMLWFNFLIDNDLGGFASTLAAQAIRTFKHRFMTHDIYIDDNASALSLARDALHGGRTEAHFIGTVPERVYKLDINSQYPAVMVNESMPARLIGHYRNVTQGELLQWLTSYCVVARVTIDTDAPAYATVQDDRLIFPTGRYTAALCTPELYDALINGRIKAIHEAAVYEPAILFKRYIEWMYHYRLTQRAKGHDVNAFQAKILMNSLYGKFAQKGLIYEKIDDTDDLSIKVWLEHDAETGETFNLRQYAGIIEQLKMETESRDSHPAIAAHITAHARAQLWGLMNVAGRGNVFYCDTDSLWVNKLGYSRLRHHCDDSQLGRLKLEGVHDHVEIYGAKDYIVDGHQRIKGVRARHYKIGHNQFYQDKFTTLIGLLRRGDMSAPIVELRGKTLTRAYTKGIVSDSGRVSPIHLTGG